MKKLLVAASCVAFLAGVSAASAQFNGPPIEQSSGQQPSGMKTSASDTGMQSNATMPKKKMKKSMMKTDKKM